MKYIITMTLNPCIDRTIETTSFETGKTNYVTGVRSEVGGKGINVAFALNHFGLPVLAMGFSYEKDREVLENAMKREGVDHAFVLVEGSMRVNRKIFDTSKKCMTELNEKGETVQASYVELLLEELEKKLPDAQALVLTGSVPPGIDAQIYRRMAEIANRYEVPVFLDANRDLLLQGIKATPFFIKPNQDEFFETFGCTKTDMLDKAKEIVEKGIAYVCISLGEEGAVLVSKDKVVQRKALPTEIASLQGAGDAMIAGICKALYKDAAEDILSYALAAAAATISLPGTVMPTLQQLNEFME